jgi:predicted metal-binding membrane protein
VNVPSAAPDTPRGAFAVLSWRINAAAVVVLLALSAFAWRSTLRDAEEMRMMATGLGHIGVLMPGMMSAPWFLAMWATMMAAMMLPAVAPMALAHLAVTRRRGDGPLATVVFVVAYLAVWAAVGLVPFAAYAAFMQAGEEAAHSRWLPALAGAILVAAGAYQFTGWKSVCLEKCKSPFAFIVAHDFDGGIASAARAGAAHGAYCVACCLPLFAVLLVVGLMNLLWMVAIFLIVLVERNWKHGLAVARAAGAALIVLGIAMAAWPAVLFIVSGA